MKQYVEYLSLSAHTGAVKSLKPQKLHHWNLQAFNLVQDFAKLCPTYTSLKAKAAYEGIMT